MVVLQQFLKKKKKVNFESKGNIHVFKSISTSQFWAASDISNKHIGHICSAL